jgi:soluble epoxide hydrolase/lipid-phosphate phosphatase
MVAFSPALSMLASTLFAGAASAAAVAAAATTAAPALAAASVAAVTPTTETGVDALALNFNPASYTKKYVTCNAVQRTASGQTTPIKLKLAYLDINPTAKKTLIMVHGWPSLWTTWRNQILGLAGYRLILPENRGFGSSQHPADLYYSNTMPDVSTCSRLMLVLT